ncbi:Zinc finger protein [Trichinella papuae]|uniref:Zinc finger protein n=1 Tax=Trichinella papuae TaxID=268474 RepID=A0A0V1MLS0_9BILA|nr:Zinc finger protein [Trichinella papuae]
MVHAFQYIILFHCITVARNGRSVEGSFSSKQGVIFRGDSRNKLVDHRILCQDRVHITMETNRFCQSCKKQFPTSYKYKMHMNIHLGIKPFVCEICGNSFSNDGAKHNHMRTHSNAAPFACPLCEKTFSWELSLKEHLISHANHGDIKANMIDDIYLQQKKQYKLKKRAEKRRAFGMTDPMMLQLSSPENCEGVSLPSANYDTYHEAAAYNPNTTVAAISENENQHPQLQQQQTPFHAIGNWWHSGYSSSNTSQTYNGRYEIINAENTAENGIQCRTNCLGYDEGTSSNLCFGNVFFNGAMHDGREDNPFPTQ